VVVFAVVVVFALSFKEEGITFGDCDDGVESSSSSSSQHHHHPVESISSRLRADDDDDFFRPFPRRRRSRCQSGRSRRLGAAASSQFTEKRYTLVSATLKNAISITRVVNTLSLSLVSLR